MADTTLAPVTLCVVVKNHDLTLRDCLNSVRGVVSDIVVVDLGSTDRSVEIAQAAGATVIPHHGPAPWPAVLDLPLEQAGTPWILRLNPDEILDPDSAALLPELVHSAQSDAFAFEMREYRFTPGANRRRANPARYMSMGASFYVPARSTRLIRKRPGLRHSGFLSPAISLADHDMRCDTAQTGLIIHSHADLVPDTSPMPLTERFASWDDVGEHHRYLAHLERGIALSQQEQFDQAFEDFDKAYVLKPCAATGFHLARALRQRGYHQRATEILSAHLSEDMSGLSHCSQSDFYEERGRCHIATGKPAPASADLRRAISLNPAAVNSIFLLAGLLRNDGRVAEALRLTYPVTRDLPGLAAGWNVLGYLLVDANAYDEAEIALRRALDIDPGLTVAGHNLAIVLDRLDRPVAARRIQRAAEQDEASSAPRVAAPLGPRGVLHIVERLTDSAGQQVRDVAGALGADHPQAVLCLSPGRLGGQEIAQTLEKQSIPVIAAAGPSDIETLRNALKPAVALHHWTPGTRLKNLRKHADQRLVLRPARGGLLPAGYDRIVLSTPLKHAPRPNISMIPNGVDTTSIATATPMRSLWRQHGMGRGGRVRVVMLSRLDHAAFYRRLAAVLAPLKGLDFDLLIAGRGARRYEIEPELQSLGLAEQVRFIGPLPAHQIGGFLRSAEVGLYLTQTSQKRFPRSVVEMMAAGLPVIAQPHGNRGGMIQHGRNGLLAWDEDGLAQALRRLVLEPELRAQMGAASRDLAAAHDLAQWRDDWRALIDGECAAL